jgi:FAD/FMN-containing dehydrogenase
VNVQLSSPPPPAPHHDIVAFMDAMAQGPEGGVPLITEMQSVRRRSRDFFWYSPILNQQLHGLSAEIIACPRDEADVIAVAAACAKLRIPLTLRGGATGNYGQAVPLKGGVLMDMTALNAIAWSRPGVVRVGAGARMDLIDAELRPQGWELRLHPSTKRMATIGGFVAGGSGGVGSVGYGGLREPGNIIAARIVTIEETPRVIELRAEAAQFVNRAYGTTGIITALEMPTAPAWPWRDVVVAFDSFDEAFAFGRDVAYADGVVKKLLSPIAWPLPSYFKELSHAWPEGKSVLVAMIAEPSMEAFRMILGARGAITHEAAFDEAQGNLPIYEFTWNHSTLQALKVDRTVTYLQCLFPPDRMTETVMQMRDAFPGEVIPHCEFIKFGGKMTCSALPLVLYKTPERLNDIIAQHEAAGVMIANPHVYTLEDGSRHKRVDADQLGFKHDVDPMGLLNPGKMRSFVAKG